MPLQNRVTPNGYIVFSSARGTLMGNRGCLHDGARTLAAPLDDEIAGHLPVIIRRPAA